MRRLLLFAAALVLLGLSTAVAASFSVQAEDVATFTTDVSISIPDPEPATLYYLTGDDGVLPGFMDPNPPPDSSVNSKAIDPGTLSSQAQTDASKHHSWNSAPAPAAGLVLNGPTTLRLFQNGSVGPATAGLFVCVAVGTPTTACTQIAGDAQSSGAESAGTEVPISFGYVSATVPSGGVLRVVVVNLGTKKWNLQWGYKSNRESRLDLPVVTP